MKKLGDFKEELEKRQNKILSTLAFDDNIYHSEILLMLIWELRSIIKIKRMLE